jgi:hypothetical protein
MRERVRSSVVRQKPRSDPVRKLSPVLFIVVVVLFFLPFVSCNGVEVSGVQAATGMTPPGSDPGGADLADAPDPLAFVSFLCAVAGIVLIRLGRTRGPLASALVAVTGSFALIGATGIAMLRAHGELGIEIGLSLAFLGFLLAAAVNDLLLARLPLLAIADEKGLARQRARALAWFAGLGAVMATSLLVSASLRGDEDPVPYLVGGLIPIAILTSVALVFAIRGYWIRAR